MVGWGKSASLLGKVFTAKKLHTKRFFDLCVIGKI